MSATGQTPANHRLFQFLTGFAGVAGINRSPAVVVAYLVLEMQMSVDDATALVRKRRPGVRPNAAILAFLANPQEVVEDATARSSTSKGVSERMIDID